MAYWMMFLVGAAIGAGAMLLFVRQHMQARIAEALVLGKAYAAAFETRAKADVDAAVKDAATVVHDVKTIL